jgi:hypothetical protein
MVCYFKGKQNTLVRSNKTQVYLFRLIALTYKVHVLTVLRPSSLKKYRDYKKGPLKYYCIFLYGSCVDMPKYKPKHVAYM